MYFRIGFGRVEYLLCLVEPWCEWYNLLDLLELVKEL